MKSDAVRHMKTNYRLLTESAGDMAAIFEILHRCPEKVFAQYSDDFRIKTYTYGQMADMTDRFATLLHSKIGANGEYIALAGENSPEWLACFWAILKSGNKPFLVNVRHPDSLIQSVVKELGIRWFAGEKSLPNYGYISFDELKSSTGTLDNSYFENEFALSTSGTTMQQTICIYTGEQVKEQLFCARSAYNDSDIFAAHYRGSYKVLAFLPFFHIFGLFAVYFWFAYYGACYVFLRSYMPDTILKTIRKHQVTHIFAVPVLWHTVEKNVMQEIGRQSPKEQRKFRKALQFCIRLQDVFPKAGAGMSKHIMHRITDRVFGKSPMLCISGGSYIRPSAMQLFNGIGYNLSNGFGMSELGITSVDLQKRASSRCRSSIGRPFSGIEYSYRNGELFIKTKAACVRMIKDGKTIEMPEYFRTGDTAYEENGYCFITGRAGDIVIGENGENISPDITEQHFTIKNASAFSVLGLGEKQNEHLALIVSVSRYLSKEQIQQIMQSVAEQNDSLPSAVRIRDFLFTYDPLMSESAIKVSRVRLRQDIESGNVKLISFAEMKSEFNTVSVDYDELTRTVISIAAMCFDADESIITPETHLIADLGGTSMQYFSFLNMLENKFKVTDFNDAGTYRYTISEICANLRERL